MYEDYLKKMKDECLLRNRAEGTYNTVKAIDFCPITDGVACP